MDANNRDSGVPAAASQPTAFKQSLVPGWKLYELCYPDLVDGLSYPPHYHEEAELWSVPSGVRGTVVVDGLAYPVEGGVFFFLPPNCIHSCELQFQGRRDLCAVHVRLPALTNMVLSCDYIGKPDTPAGYLDTISTAHRTHAGRLHRLLRSLSIIRALTSEVQARSVRQIATDCLADLRILSLTFTILMKEGDAAPPPRSHHGIRDVIDLVESRFSESLTLEQIAKECGLSRSSLCRSFKRATGMTLWDYLSVVRIRYAQKLLGMREKNVSEICYECGFQDVSYFVKVFRRHAGMTPKKWAGQGKR